MEKTVNDFSVSLFIWQVLFVLFLGAVLFLIIRLILNSIKNKAKQG